MIEQVSVSLATRVLLEVLYWVSKALAPKTDNEIDDSFVEIVDEIRNKAYGVDLTKKKE